MPRTTTRRRKKVSATLSPELIKQVVEYQREAGLDSFSAALEHIVWRQMLAEREREYYLSMSEEERAEQERWARLVAENLHKTSIVED
jgi:hypothetical protein